LPIFYQIKNRIDDQVMEFYILLSTKDFLLDDQNNFKIDLNIFEEP